MWLMFVPILKAGWRGSGTRMDIATHMWHALMDKSCFVTNSPCFMYCYMEVSSDAKCYKILKDLGFSHRKKVVINIEGEMSV